MSARILEGDVFEVLPTLEPGSIDCCITSPPYWQLRSYLPKGHPLKPHELGSEPTPAAYVEAMVRVFRLVRDVLAPWGTCWLNIGDSYAQTTVRHRRHLYEGRPGEPGGLGAGHQGADELIDNGISTAVGIEAGNLCLIPQRLAIALQDDGWIVRSVIVWHKPSAMPASLAGWMWKRCRVKVKADSAPSGYRADRPDCSPNGEGVHYDHRRPEAAQWADCPGCAKCLPHGGYVLRRGSWRPTSSWEPVLLLAKGSGYYADGVPVQTPPAAATVERDRYTRILDDPDEQFACKHDHETVCDGGANLRDVWTIAAESLSTVICPACLWVGEGRHAIQSDNDRLCRKCRTKVLSHYAAFPSDLVYRCLAAGTSQKGHCPRCSAPWARVVESRFINGRGNSTKGARKGCDESVGWDCEPCGTNETTTLGWRPTCTCPGAADLAPRPPRVLDIFSGSGRVGVQCQRLGLDYTGIELSPVYAEMQRRLLAESNPLFADLE